MTAKSKRNSCVCVLWKDAAYTNDIKALEEIPPPQLTCGFLIEKNKDFVNLAVNSYYTEEERRIELIDGFIIPVGTIIKIKKVGFYEKR